MLSVTGSLASTVGQINPFRYRGYYYDSETGFYYLNTRYYDPEVGRFLNADSIIGANGEIQGYNMFAYCNNNPVMYSDHFGMDAAAAEEVVKAWYSTAWGLAAADGPLPVGEIVYVVGGALLGFAAYLFVDTAADTIDSPSIDIKINYGPPSPPRIDPDPIPLDPPDFSLVFDKDSLPVTGEPNVEYAKSDYDPDPYKRPNQKKQGRENKNKARKKKDWEPRNNRRDRMPRKPKHHTPGDEHRKYKKVI